MKRNLKLAFFSIVCLLASLSASATSYYGGEIILKYGEQKTVNLGEALKEAMNSYGAGYPHTWKSSNKGIVRTTMPQRTSCTLYACGIGSTTLTYHGEYYRNGTISDIDCTWDVTVEQNNPGNNTGDNNSGSTFPEDNLESWQDYGNYDITWYKKTTTEFEISTPQQLAGLAYLTNHDADFAGQTINITQDIDLGGKTWIAIGEFNGIFDGQGHTISHLNIIIPVGSYSAGFFGELSGNSIVRNLSLQGVVDAKRYCKRIGGFAGSSSGIIENVSCYIPVNVSMNIGSEEADISIGGFAGSFSGKLLTHSKYYGNVNIQQYPNTTTSCYRFYTRCGGFIGTLWTTGGTVECCESMCNEIVIKRPSKSQALNASVGGFIGYQRGNYNTCKYNRSIVESIILSNSDWQGFIDVGTLIGYKYDAKTFMSETINCFAIVNRFSISSGVMGSTNYIANDCDIIRETYTNSGVDGLAYLRSKSFNTKTRTLEFMRSSGFLEELNMYSILNLDGPIWEMGDDGFPQLQELHTSVGIYTPQMDSHIERDGIYSLTGVRQPRLQRGLNIVGGKKVYIK